jgi:hypothetical protein
MRHRTTGKVYLLCFRDQEGNKAYYQHAGHYLGFAGRDEDDLIALEARLEEHRAGRGARLTQVAVAAGLTFKVTRTWKGTRGTERLLKETWHSGVRLCPDCTPGAERHGLNRKRQRILALAPF